MISLPPGLEQEVLYEVVDGHIAVVTLNRPEVRNAINGIVARALDYFVKQTERDDSIRVCILASSQDKAFCAGADLAEISAGRGDTLMTPDGGFAGFVDQKRTKPWIAAVRGPALAGGCELALACDMIVVADNSRFGLPEVKRGLFAGAGGVYRLPRLIPRNVALEMIATGDPIDAQRAHALGLVNRVVPSEGVFEAALGLARAIAANAPLSVRASLQVARVAAEMTDSEVAKMAHAISRPVMLSEDAKEGALAFLEKRPARWQGR
jgi:enoyl-CoA hydratase/carnithine racemase